MLTEKFYQHIYISAKIPDLKVETIEELENLIKTNSGDTRYNYWIKTPCMEYKIKE